jgi:hypothetical protein
MVDRPAINIPFTKLDAHTMFPSRLPLSAPFEYSVELDRGWLFIHHSARNLEPRVGFERQLLNSDDQFRPNPKLPKENRGRSGPLQTEDFFAIENTGKVHSPTNYFAGSLGSE